MQSPWPWHSSVTSSPGVGGKVAGSTKSIVITVGGKEIIEHCNDGFF